MERDNVPKVSIGLPVFNGERHLAAALDSLLAQSFSDFEIVISDNASTDKTEEVCRRYAARDPRIRYFRQPSNLGAAPNFNRTFEYSRGKYFRWHAHDDLCRPEFVERCVVALDANARAILCMPNTRFIDDEGRDVGPYLHPLNLGATSRVERFLQFVLPGHIVVEAFALIRADVLRRTRLIASYIGSDLVLLGELGLYGSFINLDDELFLHREHPNRSVHSHRDSRSRSAWFDTRAQSAHVYPTWRLLFEHCASMWRAPLTPGERLQIFIGVLRRANWSRAQLAAELWH